MSSEHRILLREHATSEEIKKSLFIARAAPAQDEAQAFQLIEQLSDPGASHNCWAFKMGDLVRFNDDGEPGGTAGRPILAAIENKGFDRTVVVVTRHYGGIKLGKGGLARAYGGGAAKCLDSAPSRRLKPHVLLQLTLPLEMAHLLHQVVATHRARIIQQVHDSRQSSARVDVASARADAFSENLTDLCKGRCEVKRLQDPRS